MQFEFREVLGPGQRHHASVVGPGGQFREVDRSRPAVLGILDEELHPPNATSAQFGGDGRCHGLGLLKQVGLHCCGLPTLLVIAALLAVPNGRAEEGVPMVLGQGEQGDFVVEVDECLHDDFGQVAPRAFQSEFPSFLDVSRRADDALAFARTGHQGLDHTGHAHGFDAGLEIVERSRVFERGGFQPELGGRQVADGLAVHREMGRLRRRHDADALFLVFVKALRADGFHLGDNNVRLVFRDNGVECLPVEHGNHFKAIGHLHRGGTRIGIHGNDMLAQTL